MRNLRNQNLVHNPDYTKYPNGTIQNETTALPGTPVVEEVYGDILQNVYAILRDRGVLFNNVADNEVNGYQLYQALKLIVNDLNDVVRILQLENQTLTESSWKVNINLNIVPENYFFFAKPDSDFDSEVVNFLSFDSSEVAAPKPIVSSGFSTGDVCLVIFGSAQVDVYSLSRSGSNPSNNQLDMIPAMFGVPMSYNDSFQEIWYYDNSGIAFSDNLRDIDVAAIINALNPSFSIRDVCSMSGHFIVNVWSGNGVKVIGIPIDNPGSAFEFTAAPPLPSGLGSDPDVYMFVNKDAGNELYLTNNSGATSDNGSIDVYEVSIEDSEITFLRTFDIDGGFDKSTNTVADAMGLIQLDGLVLRQISEAAPNILTSNFPQSMKLFSISTKVYFTNGSIGSICRQVST